MSSIFAYFPDKEELLASYRPHKRLPFRKVNNHIHTPYSFSAFASVSEAVQKAVEADVRILGINDFYVCSGYEEFQQQCCDLGVFPLFNIELIGVSTADQKAGIRINDPGNPGRIYVSGKGLAHPSILPAESRQKLDRIVEESNQQVGAMICLLNAWLERKGLEFRFSFDELMADLAEGLLRERHLAKAVRLKLEEVAASEEELFSLLELLYDGRPSACARGDRIGLENELRARLLKSAAPAYVPEDEKAFLPLPEIMSLIRKAGGEPAYPMLLDGTGAEMTDFEANMEGLMDSLSNLGFRLVECIPRRNQAEVLQQYVTYFYEHGFVVSFGTEHNSSAMEPLEVRSKGGAALDEEMQEISLRGAAWQAAYQYLFEKEGRSCLERDRDEMEFIGRAVLQHYFYNCNC